MQQTLRLRALPRLAGLMLAGLLAGCALAQAAPQETEATPMDHATNPTGIFWVDPYIEDRGDPSSTTAGIVEAIEAAVAWGEGATVMFDRGDYRVRQIDGRGDYVFKLGNVTNLTIRGMGAATRLVITDPSKGGFIMAYCEDVTIRDLVVDYDPVPFTQGRITNVDVAAGRFTMTVDPGYPEFSAAFLQNTPKPFGRFGLFMEPDRRQIKTGAPDFVFIETWEKADKGWDVIVDPEQANKLEDAVPGDRFVQLARYGHAIFFYDRSRECTVLNVTVHTGPGVSVGSMEAEAIRFKNYAVRFPAGSDRLLTTTADGLHMQANVVGPTVEDCYFEGMADDAINLYHFPNYIAAVNSGTEIEVDFGNRIYEGDELTFFNARSGSIVGEATALRVVNHTERDFGPKTITLDRAVTGLTPGENHQDADTIYNNSRCGAGFTIRNNIFRDHRRYAMMIKAPDGLIEGNLIRNLGGFAIMVGNDPDWPEGAMPDNITVRGNTIIGGGHSKYYANYDNAASIMVQSKGLNGEVARDIGVHDIRILDNNIIDPPGAGIFIGSVRDALVRNNRVHYAPLPYKRSPGAALRLDNVRGLVVEGLHVSSTDPLVSGAIEDFAEKGESEMRESGVVFQD